jgi:hypothetical protein
VRNPLAPQGGGPFVRKKTGVSNLWLKFLIDSVGSEAVHLAVDPRTRGVM